MTGKRAATCRGCGQPLGSNKKCQDCIEHILKTGIVESIGRKGGGIEKVFVGQVGGVKAIIKPARRTASERVATTSSKSVDGVAQLKALLAESGLDWPPIPAELAPRLKERGRWWFATSEPVRFSPYAYFPYIEAGSRKRVENYVLVAHDGHGVNSYAIHYYLVRRPLRLFLQVGWGGVYMDAPKVTEEVNRCFALVGQLVPAVETAVRARRLRADDRLLVAASEFSGCYWIKPGEEKKQEIPGDNPRLALTTVLRWVEGLTGP